jgi:DNA-directed RNA polymerase alpha subunit
MDITVIINKLTLQEIYSLKKIIDKRFDDLIDLSEKSDIPKLSDLDISIRSFNVLKQNNIITLMDLTQFKKWEFRKIKGASLKVIDELTDELKKKGLDWKP